jgi:hypothetical protein
MNEPFRLLMISAMYENGGNTTQRLLDGHPELVSYPFESQLGTRLVQDHLSSLYPAKYRWPEFALDGTPEGDYEAIIDEECKVRIKTPSSSKFRDAKIALDDRERKASFVSLLQGRPRSRRTLTEAFLRASAEAWRDRARSDRERVYVGYSPIVGVDADRILADHSEAHVLNVVRNPWAAYADTKKRAVPLSLPHYVLGWTVHLQHALAFADRFQGRAHILRYEDLVADPRGALRDVLGRMGIGDSPTLTSPSWNGQPLREVHPWGTIRTPTPEANQKTAAELSPEEHEEVRRRAQPLLGAVGYA